MNSNVDRHLIVPAPRCVAVIGAGPAGLMAAQMLAEAGAQVTVFDTKATVGRKFLLAGRGGLNLTHSEPLDRFIGRYGPRADALAPQLHAFGPQAVREWAHALGSETFVGTSGRVFPRAMKAAPLLRAWLQRLHGLGVVFRTRHRWLGWNEAGELRFATPTGEQHFNPQATVLALGGASWPRLGSDGAWVPLLQARGVALQPLQAANCGFDVQGGWSDYLRQRFAGQPVKPVVARCAAAGGSVIEQQGEFVLTDGGVEGSLIYALAATLRDAITRHGSATLTLDLLPSHSAQQVLAETTRPRGPRSLATHLKSRLNISGLKLALLHEVLGAQANVALPLCLIPAGDRARTKSSPEDCSSPGEGHPTCLPDGGRPRPALGRSSGMNDPAQLAAALKALPLVLAAPRPLAEAISTAGGVAFEAMNDSAMLLAMPGVFCAGEMLDWEAPTGGYLLTACLASGRAAGLGALAWCG